jgi:diacylglycerol kinase
MSDEFRKSRRSWPRKFAEAFRAMVQGVWGQGSFVVHFTCAFLVIALAAILRLGPVEWCLLTLCIFGVFTAEMFNSALESLAKAIDTRYNPHLAEGLNIASAAVLTCAIGSVVVGLIVFGCRLVQLVD